MVRGHKGFTIGKNSEVLPGERITYPGGINLFNLETDIGETTNVADQNPEVVQELLTLHKKWASRNDTPVYEKEEKEMNVVQISQCSGYNGIKSKVYIMVASQNEGSDNNIYMTMASTDN